MADMIYNSSGHVIKATRFRSQVRRLTGALVAVGQGRLSVSQIQELLEARDSLAFPHNLTAPAHGLFLTRVQYRDTGKKCSEHRSAYMCMYCKCTCEPYNHSTLHRTTCPKMQCA